MTTKVPTRYSGPVELTRSPQYKAMKIAEMVLLIGLIAMIILAIYAAVDLSIATNQKP